MLKKAPPIHPISNIVLPKVEQQLLDNGMPLAVINVGSQDICFLSLAFNAGRAKEKQKIVARTTAFMMKEGTNMKSSAQISETIDFHGSQLSIHSGMDYLKVDLYCLTKHLDTIIPLLQDILTSPSFPESELQRFKQRSTEKLKEQLKRTEIVSYRELTSILYGDNHPYGYNSSAEMIKDLNINGLQDHFNSVISANNGVAVLTGRISDKTLKLVTECLNSIPSNNTDFQWKWPVIKPTKKVFKQKIDHSLQTSIRMGTKLFHKKHDDYDSMYLVNMVLGGYFGSRLTLKIREELGLVYGIYSNMDTLKHDGTFYISTETSHENINKAKTAILEQINDITAHKVSEQELKRAKNYLLGRILYMVNGTFELSQTVMQSLIEKKDPTHIIDRIDRLKNIEQNQILNTAQKYLGHQNWTEVFIGG